jgi:hypothetical protein
MLTAREGDHLGRAPRGQPQHLRRSRFHRGQQAHTQAGRDADRLLGALRGQGPAGPSHGPEQANSPRTNGFVERFKGTVLEEFFRPTMRSRLHESVEVHDEKVSDIFSSSMTKASLTSFPSGEKVPDTFSSQQATKALAGQARDRCGRRRRELDGRHDRGSAGRAADAAARSGATEGELMGVQTFEPR